MLICPKCSSGNIVPSSLRNVLEPFLLLFGRSPFRCCACARRFFAFATPSERIKINRRRAAAMKAKARYHAA